MPHTRNELERDFWAKVNLDGPFPEHVPELDRCWQWHGWVNNAGYGLFSLRGERIVVAHRWIYQVYNGPVPRTIVCMHRCDNKLCMNLDHITTGTQADNIADKVAKGRQAMGSRTNTARLVESQVAEMREFHRQHPHFRVCDVGNHFRKVHGWYISKTMLYGILNYSTWRHVP